MFVIYCNLWSLVGLISFLTGNTSSITQWSGWDMKIETINDIMSKSGYVSGYNYSTLGYENRNDRCCHPKWICEPLHINWDRKMERKDWLCYPQKVIAHWHMKIEKDGTQKVDTRAAIITDQYCNIWSKGIISWLVYIQCHPMNLIETWK